MKTEISYADWLDWLAFELTFIELYKSATPPQKREMRATLRRLAEGIGQAELDAFVSQIPSFAEELSCSRPRNATASRVSSRRPSPNSPSTWPASPENGIETALGCRPLFAHPRRDPY